MPYPNVHLSFVSDEPAMVHGVPRGHVVTVLPGARGGVPAGLLPAIPGQPGLGAHTRVDALAAELGYADQAHLTRDLTALVGESPTRYAQRYPAGTVNRR